METLESTLFQFCFEPVVHFITPLYCPVFSSASECYHWDMFVVLCV